MLMSELGIGKRKLVLCSLVHYFPNVMCNMIYLSIISSYHAYPPYLSIISINLVYQSYLSIISIYHIYKSHIHIYMSYLSIYLSIMSINHTYLSYLSITYISYLSYLSMMSINHIYLWQRCYQMWSDDDDVIRYESMMMMW